MLTATVTIKTSKVGSTVVKENVTPPEAMYLVASHKNEAGGQPILKVENEKEVIRDDMDELNRLQAIYPIQKINALFPGVPPRYPEDFDQAKKWGLHAVLPTTRLFDHDIAKAA